MCQNAQSMRYCAMHYSKVNETSLQEKNEDTEMIKVTTKPIPVPGTFDTYYMYWITTYNGAT